MVFFYLGASESGLIREMAFGERCFLRDRLQQYNNNLFYVFLQSLSSSVAFGFGCTYISRFEEQAVGIQWSNINTSPVPDDQFNMYLCILIMLADAAMYGILTWYMEAVFPGRQLDTTLCDKVCQ